MARKIYNDYERSSPPIESIEFGGRWHYRMTLGTATAWRSVRALEVIAAPSGESVEAPDG